MKIWLCNRLLIANWLNAYSIGLCASSVLHQILADDGCLSFQVADEEETLLAFMAALQKSGPAPRPAPVQIARPKAKGKQKR